MASKVLDLLIKVTDQASDKLEDIKGSTTGGGGGVEGLSTALLAASGQAVLAGMALQKIGNFTSENIEEFTDYVLNVDRLGEAFGLSVEEAEEVVLMADAMGLSNDALFSTLNKLTREGFGVGMEALEGLREEFQDVEDPADRAQFLFGVAGEQGQKVLAPMLSMTELEWKDLIEGIEALTQIDDDMVSNAEDLAVASAGIETAWTNLKLELVNFAAPGLTALLEDITAALSGNPLERRGPTGFERMTGTTLDMQSGTNVGSPNTGMMADRDRWDAIADSMADKVGTAVKDAVERID